MECWVFFRMKRDGESFKEVSNSSSAVHELRKNYKICFQSFASKPVAHLFWIRCVLWIPITTTLTTNTANAFSSFREGNSWGCGRRVGSKSLTEPKKGAPTRTSFFSFSIQCNCKEGRKKEKWWLLLSPFSFFIHPFIGEVFIILQTFLVSIIFVHYTAKVYFFVSNHPSIDVDVGMVS